MTKREQTGVAGKVIRGLGWGLVGLTPVIILLPDSLPVGSYRLLGSPYFRPQDDYLTRLFQAAGQSFWMAGIGTAVVLFGSLVLGLAQGGGRSGRTFDLPLLLTIGAVAVPDLALLIALRKAWPSVPVPLNPDTAAFAVRAIVALALLVAGWWLFASARAARRAGRDRRGAFGESGVGDAGVRSRQRRLGLVAVCVLAATGVILSPASVIVSLIQSAAPRVLERPSTAMYDLVRNVSVLLLLAVLAMPIPARLIASRVRSLKRRLFVKASRTVGAKPLTIFRREILPHLVEDIAWVAALTLPRFVHIEVGLFFLGLGYSDFHGLGELLEDSRVGQAQPGGLTRLGVTIGMIVWLSLIPQIVLRLCGIRVHEVEKDV
jgi:ABC-type dipeptide/oligopeptide/nickel transport system permease subunit